MGSVIGNAAGGLVKPCSTILYDAEATAGFTFDTVMVSNTDVLENVQIGHSPLLVFESQLALKLKAFEPDAGRFSTHVIPVKSN